MERNSLNRLIYREAGDSDTAAMASIRTAETADYAGGTESFRLRIAGYLAGTHNPQQALPPRIVYVALDGDSVAGYAAGHLTRRYGCDGELQWLYVVPEHRGGEAASHMLRMTAAWFAEHNAPRVCVNVAPDNGRARRFYIRHGAVELNENWLVWNDVAACSTHVNMG
jgi:ribosomal protein S18 acetylase RimI-like enzyme